MTNEKYLALQNERRREFIDWLYGLIETELNIPLSTFARMVGMDYRTVENLKKGTV